MNQSRIIVRSLVLISILILFQTTAADTDITVRPSLMVEYSVEPVYLMPGDTGTVTVTLKNAAKDYAYSIPVKNKTEIFDLSAQVIDASLTGTSIISVTSNSYYDV